MSQTSVAFDQCRSSCPFGKAGVILIATLAVYLPSMRGGFIWDDVANVQANQTLRSTGGLVRTWTTLDENWHYYPLTHTSFWIEYQLWKLNTLGYHLINVLLHAMAGLLLWRVLAALAVPGAWVAAAVFCLHPVHVDSVAWISERKNVLYGAFYLGAMLAYLRFLSASGGGKWRTYGLALGLFLAAMLSKPVACTFPPVVLLLLWWKRQRITVGDVLALVPFFAVGIGLGLLSAWVERQYLGAVGPEFEQTFVERSLIAGRALWFYAGKLLWPHPLMFIYPRWSIDAGAWVQYLLPATAICLPAALWLVRYRIGKAPLVAVLCFGGTLFPALGFFNVYFMRYSYVADHFQYLASAPLIALVVAAAAVALRRTGTGRTVHGVAPAAVLVTLGVLTWSHAFSYADEPTVWRDTVRKNPGGWMPRYNLGVVLESEDRLDDAVGHYLATLKIKPDQPVAHNNLGNVLNLLGLPEEAVEHYGEALRISPDFALAHYNLGVVLGSQDRLDEAADHFHRAFAIEPAFSLTHRNAATALLREGRLDEAVRHFRVDVRIDPDDALAHSNLGTTLGRLGRLDEAAGHLRRALSLDANLTAARANLDHILKMQGRAKP